ncbi:uncharacterized protein LOC125673918 isoform X2 [Ostrea edulis]|uniref:uncharacterized protein LOC125673918 isoform X2 n=1 Tax=Ostrea edulis TaxID=37623 RepID=UPI0024AF7F8F|nr:uncharacterized protein LOC125673918 isoform X2 [Ostrea edulis]XP_048766833.2 uncharacterized protein LOC125673918 isoform X2 [Ostrea edulis]XP_048766834.2 uncharacterized protein LOC125673918 isoform X2 [Ostrea edulis]
MAASASPTRRPSSSFTPLVQKPRPRTSLPLHHQSFAATPRIRSAVLTMPRSHVSIARFYDWSEDLGECVSVSKFYRDLAVASQRQDKVKARNKYCSNGTHTNPGRMFLRDKAGLTKGEREIIEGIYRNRGDLPREPENSKSYSFKDEWDFVRSHKDAWMIGKQLQKQGFKFDPSLQLKVPEYLFSRLRDDESNSPREFCKICESNRLSESNLDDSGFCVHWKGKYPSAPPTTPDADAGEFEFPENVPIKKKSVPRIKSEQERQISEQRIRVVKSVDESLLSGGSRDKADRKKVFVNVFLPRIPIDAAHAYSSAVVTDNKVNSFMADYSRNSSASRMAKVRKDPASFVNSLSITNSQPHNTDCD